MSASTNNLSSNIRLEHDLGYELESKNDNPSNNLNYDDYYNGGQK